MTDKEMIEFMDRQIERSNRERQAGEKVMASITFPEGLTREQTRVLKQVIMDIPRFDFYNSTDYEVKSFEITVQSYGDIYVTFTTGCVGDEGTMASVLCRKNRNFFIGKKGGIQVLNKKYNFKRISRFELMNERYWS